jgi:hypothetical protein
MLLSRRSSLGCSRASLRRLVLATLLMAGILQPSNARACAAQISGAAATPVGAEVAYMASVIYWWNYYMYDLMDRLPRLANSKGANTESENRATTTNTDKIAIEQTRLKVGEVRSELVGEYVPSTLTCQVASQQKRLENANQNYQAMRDRMSATGTRGSLGAPGSGTEKGSVQSLAKAFSDRCGTYFDSTQIALPAGLTCPTNADPKMVNRDISPWTSIFQPINLPAIPATGAWPPYTQAAYDTIKLLIEPTVPDHIKGQALSRPEGQNIHLMRMRDLSRINLARGALEDIVAKRIEPLTADPQDNKKVSRIGRYIEMISGQSVTGNSVSGELNSVLNAGLMRNTQVQSVLGRLESQKMMLAEFLRYTEQLLALEAVHLGIKIEETKGKGTTSASSVTKAN